MTKIEQKTLIRFIAFVEIIIGFVTVLGLACSAIFLFSKKPLNVFLFVLVSALISGILGFGLFAFKNWARKLLIFFSGWVILTKLLVFMNILQFSGDLLSFVSSPLKNALSIIYHTTVIILLNKASFKKLFGVPG